MIKGRFALRANIKGRFALRGDASRKCTREIKLSKLPSKFFSSKYQPYNTGFESDMRLQTSVRTHEHSNARRAAKTRPTFLILLFHNY